MFAALAFLAAIAGLGIAAASSASSSSAQQRPLASAPAATPSGAPPGSVTPPTWTPNETTYFDILPNGTRVWREPYRSQILAYLNNYGVVPAIKDDMTVMLLVAKNAASDATAAQWLAAFQSTRVVMACRWMLIQHALRPGQPPYPEYLRAVAPGEESLWAGAHSTAAYALLTQPGQLGGGITPPTPPTPPAPTGNDVFSELPPALAEELRGMMRDSVDPSKLILVADGIESAHPNDAKYRKAADALRTRARELRIEQETRAIAQGRVYIVRPNDLQSEIAQWFTGDGLRWRELNKTNPELRMQSIDRGDGKRIEYYAPWVSGQKVILPPGWNAEKGPPPARLRSEPRAAA